MKNIGGQGRKRRYCLLAGLVAFIIILVISVQLHRYSIFQWNLFTWIAVLGVILVFMIGGFCAYGKKDRR